MIGKKPSMRWATIQRLCFAFTGWSIGCQFFHTFWDKIRQVCDLANQPKDLSKSTIRSLFRQKGRYYFFLYFWEKGGGFRCMLLLKWVILELGARWVGVVLVWMGWICGIWEKLSVIKIVAWRQLRLSFASWHTLNAVAFIHSRSFLPGGCFYYVFINALIQNLLANQRNNNSIEDRAYAKWRIG